MQKSAFFKEKIRKLKRHPLILCLETVMIVAVSDCVTMFILDHFGFQLTSTQENFYEPALMGVLSVPLVYFLVILPFIQEASHAASEILKAKARAEEAHLKNFEILSEQAKTLGSAVELATKELKASEDRYALAAQGSNDGLWDWDKVTNTVYYSSRWQMMLGYREEDFSNSIQCWLNHTHPADRDELEKKLQNLTPQKSSFSYTYRMRTSFNDYMWVLTRGKAVFDEHGNMIRIAGSQTDISEQKKTEEKLIYNAYHDPLTGIGNRVLFHDRLNEALLYAQQSEDSQFAILFLDLDDFKKVNDTFGHSAGDILLKNITKRILSLLCPTDVLARLGGDEFAIILHDVKNESDVKKVAKNLSLKISRPITIKKYKIFSTVSIGVAFLDGTYKSIETLIRNVDFALYRAKESGKNRFAIFDAEMRDQAATLFKKENQLKQALKKDQFHVFYQPIVEIESSKIKGFEALLRWEHPRFGWVSPIEFIRIAEESDLILDLGAFVLETAAQQFKIWKEEYEELDFISVNVSAKQLENRFLLKQVQNVLKSISPHELKLEITETAVMKNPENAKNLLHNIHQLGVKIAIDDFGTGYSSLSMLHEFPIDVLKIDRSFIKDITTKKGAQEIVFIIQMMAKKLDLETIAEGVETENEFKILHSMGCDFAQGFYFSKPISADDTEKLLGAQQKNIKMRA